MNDVFEIVKLIKNTPGTKAKTQILKDNLDNKELMQLFIWAYDWTKTIGITVEKTELNSRERYGTIEEVKEVVAKLQSRELSGDAARNAVTEVLLGFPPDEQEILIDFLNKKPRLGIGDTVLEKLAPDLVPRFNGCMLAEKWEGRTIKFPVLVDPKIDGMRCLVVVKDGSASAYTRQGNALPQVQFICDQILKIKTDSLPADMVFDGELFAGDWGKTLKLTKTHDDIDRSELLYNVFDYLPFKDWENGKWKTVNQDFRTKMIHELCGDRMSRTKNIVPVQGKIINSIEELREYYDECLQNGYEGVMIKDLNGTYECKRSKSWMKFKPEETIDYPIHALFEGKGRLTGTLGGLTLRKPNGDLLGVGSGFTDATRADLWGRGEELIGKMCEVKYQPGREGAAEFAVFSKIRDDL